jgi:hypothetical protein
MSEKLTPHVYNKAGWGVGEWFNEPDRVDFIHKGFSCFVQRNNLGAWCGYVGVPKSHTAYGTHYNRLNLTVHGGLTYAAKCTGPICHIPQPGMPDDVWWLGFDCAHGQDIVPGMAPHLSFPGSTYKNLAYVKKQTMRLAEQLAA